MATVGKAVAAEATLPTKADIQDLASRMEALKKGFLAKWTDLLSPLTEKIDQLTLSIQKVSSIAEGAMDLSVLQQEDIKELQEHSESHEEKLAILGNRQRAFNLKFRDIEENAEGTTDLIIYMSNWLARTLDLQGEAYPVITQAYRLGKAKNPAKPFPRDIIVTFADVRVKNKILKVAKEQRFLPHKNDKVSVFLDLSPETLQKKRELKGIIAALNEANLRHRWATPLKLQIFHKGKSYFVKTEEEGYDILKGLNVPIPMQTEKTSFKRKSNVVHSPEKFPKKPSVDSSR